MKLKIGLKIFIILPIDLLAQIIKPLSQEIKELSADPYDEELMDNFCSYITVSQRKIEKVDKLYKSISVPNSISSLGLDLYHCFSQVKDALSELDKYTQGYVDDYLFDGKEMMKEAKRIQSKMAYDKKSIIS
jgi:molecular chaperone DnaJ